MKFERKALLIGIVAITLIPYATGQVASDSTASNTQSGIDKALIENYIRSYPNPTNGPVTVELGKSYKNVVVEIRSVSGKLVSKETFEEISSIDTSIDGPAGIYFLKVTGHNMRQIIHRVSKK